MCYAHRTQFKYHYMFDFQATIDLADKYAKNDDKALATFYYWLIGYAYQDEEFPYSYTTEIGARGKKGFLKLVNKYKNEILSDSSYVSYKEFLKDSFTYRKYFENFERVVNFFINRGKR